MLKRLLPISMVAVLLALAACSGKKSGTHDLPSNFGSMNDEQRMAYLMRHAEPDSVARFLCEASLGKIPGAKIDTLAIAYSYVLDNYQGQDADVFSMEFQRLQDQMTLADKMQTGFRLGIADTLQVGYDLGLGYVAQIRDRHLGVKDIDAEISEFRKACKGDTATYNRFVRGFKTALEMDKGRDLSNEIYLKYSRM